ncbi:MAG: hypothetical protein IKO72_02690 [Kiritimatiellae bacterium]|nr:hypothetical protein [Kiritimatiellia bacterium]
MARYAILLAMALAAAAGMAADPYVGYIYPCGIQAGTTNRLMVGGQGFWGILDAGVTGGGVHVLGVDRMALSGPPAGSQLAWMRKWLDGIIVRGDPTRPAMPTNAAARVNEWTVNAWWNTLDQLDRRELAAVERDIFVRKNSLQMTPSLRQILFVDVAVDADAKPGRRELCVWTTSGISPPRPLIVTAAPHVEEPLYTPPHRKKGPLPAVSNFPVVLDGCIMPGETDRFELVLRKGMRLEFDVTARELQPYIGDAVPGFFNAVMRLVGSGGREIAFSDDRDRFRPDPAFTCVVPEDGTYTLELHDNLFRGREDFVYAVNVSEKPKPPAAAPKGTARPAAAQTLACGGEVRGCIMPGAQDRYGVSLKGPGTFVFDLRARRDGSPLDGVLTLKDAAGRVVWRHDDVTNDLFVGSIAQAECDAIGRVALSAGESRDYSITVEDLTGHGGKDYRYTLSLRREKPGFELYTSRSAMVSRGGVRQPMTMHVVRHGGFDGPLAMLETAEFRFENGYIPAGTNEFKAVFIGKTREEQPLRPVRIRAFAEVEGRPVVADAVPADECMQAFAWRHLLPARSFIVKNLPPWSPRLPRLKQSETLVLVGSAATPGVVRNVRLALALRRPYTSPEVTGTNTLPHLPLPAGGKPIMLTPLPYDQYGDQRTENLRLNSTARMAEAAEVRRTASMKGVALAELHDPLTQTLRERVAMRLCGEDRQSPSAELELLAALRILEAIGESSEVAHVTINAATRREDLSQARVSGIKVSKTGVSFTYAPRALPLPVTDVYRRVDAIYPVTARFNREILSVKKLETGTYALRFNGEEVGRYSSLELAKGINLAPLDTPSQRMAKEMASSGRLDVRPRDVRVELARVSK